MRARWIIAMLLVTLVTLPGCRIIARMNIPSGGPFPATPGDAPATSPALSGDGSVAVFSSTSASLVAGDVLGFADVFLRVGEITSRLSLTPGATGGNGDSTDPQLAADGSVVVFVSLADDLVAGDTNGVADVFVVDLVTGTITRVSVASGGGEANGASGEPAISADGRYVIFTSDASNLIGTDANGVSDVFVHDRTANTTTRVSVTGGGGEANGASRSGAISPSGDWVAYESDASNIVGGDSNGATDVFAALRTGGSVLRMSTPDAITRPFQQSNGASTDPEITDPLTGFIGGGEPLVVYTSTSTNLAGSDNNGSNTDVFATTRLFGAIVATTRLSSSTDASHSPTVSEVDGGPAHVMAFVTGDDVISTLRSSPVDLSGLKAQNVTETVSGAAPNGVSTAPSLSGDGRYITFITTAGNLISDSGATTLGDAILARARDVVIDSIDDPNIAVGESRSFTVNGSGFDVGATAFFDGGIVVDSVTFVSSTELIVSATAVAAEPGVDFRDLTIYVPGIGGTSVGGAAGQCEDCIEIAAVVEQAGPVDIEIISGSLTIDTLSLPFPSCPFGFCPAIPATVGFDGVLGFGAASVELDGIEIPVELIPGIETTVELVPFFNAPGGAVIPASGSFDLSGGLGIEIRNLLLPSGCNLGAGIAVSTANPGATAYNQTTGEAVLVGNFTEELAITGCGLFTGVLNALLGLPSPIANNEIVLGVRLDPILTGTIIP